jgi:hypothetical protein
MKEEGHILGLDPKSTYVEYKLARPKRPEVSR